MWSINTKYTCTATLKSPKLTLPAGSNPHTAERRTSARHLCLITHVWVQYTSISVADYQFPGNTVNTCTSAWLIISSHPEIQGSFTCIITPQVTGNNLRFIKVFLRKCIISITCCTIFSFEWNTYIGNKTLCNHQNMSMEAITPTYGNDVLCYRCHTRVAFVYMMEVIELMFYFLVGPYFQRQFYSATSLDSVVIAHIELQCPI